MGKKHTSALDIVKLARLGPADADVVGLLLVGFDTEVAPVGPDRDELERLRRLSAVPWTGSRDH